jgi:hypothetical protein
MACIIFILMYGLILHNILTLSFLKCNHGTSTNTQKNMTVLFAYIVYIFYLFIYPTVKLHNMLYNNLKYFRADSY